MIILLFLSLCLKLVKLSQLSFDQSYYSISFSISLHLIYICFLRIKCISCRQHIVMFYIFSLQKSLILIDIVRPLVLKVIIDTIGIRSAMFVIISYLLHLFFVSLKRTPLLFLPSVILIEHLPFYSLSLSLFVSTTHLSLLSFQSYCIDCNSLQYTLSTNMNSLSNNIVSLHQQYKYLEQVHSTFFPLVTCNITVIHFIYPYVIIIYPYVTTLLYYF